MKQPTHHRWSPPPRAGRLEHLSNALHAEALAMLYAVNVASRIGCNRIILETDSTVLKQAVSTETYNSAELGALFQEIKHELRVSIDDVKQNVCSRTCNVAAHTLAALGTGLGNGNFNIWVGHFPEFVTNLVAGDNAGMVQVMEYLLFL